MKNLFSILILFLSFSMAAQQEDNSYVMFQTITLNPKSGQGPQLRAALRAHNAKYHREGSQTVNVWNVNSGKRFGSLLWVKGPLTWTDMDAPLDVDGHMDDWRDNVTPNADIKSMEYWRLLNGMDYMPDNFVPKVMVVRYFDIKQQKNDNARKIWEDMFKVYTENNYDMGLQIYSNQANAADGRDWAIIWYHENFASMDKNRKFWDAYEKIAGADSREFFENWNAVSEYSGMEILTLAEGLSAATPSND